MMKPYQFFTTAPLFILILPLSAVRGDEALQLADYLFAQQSYSAAITEYKRFIFFHPDNECTSDAYYQIALAHRADEDWKQSAEAFGESIKHTKDPCLKGERRIELGTTLIASGQYYYALLELQQVSQSNKDLAIRRKAVYFQGVAYLYTFNWEEARQAFAEFYSASTTPEEADEGKRVDTLLYEAQRLPHRSEKIAKILSTILPGVGQSYAGAWKKGLNALALNGIIMFFVVDNALIGDYGDASLLLAFMFSRYYSGNRYRAKEAVQHFNSRLDRQQAEKILSALLE